MKTKSVPISEGGDFPPFEHESISEIQPPETAEGEPEEEESISSSVLEKPPVVLEVVTETEQHGEESVDSGEVVSRFLASSGPHLGPGGVARGVGSDNLDHIGLASDQNNVVCEGPQQRGVTSPPSYRRFSSPRPPNINLAQSQERKGSGAGILRCKL